MWIRNSINAIKARFGGTVNGNAVIQNGSIIAANANKLMVVDSDGTTKITPNTLSLSETSFETNPEGGNQKVTITKSSITAINVSGTASLTFDTDLGSLTINNGPVSGITQTWSNDSNGVVATVNFDGTFEVLFGNVQATQGNLIAGLNQSGNSRIAISPTTIAQIGTLDDTKFSVDADGNVFSASSITLNGNIQSFSNAIIGNDTSGQSRIIISPNTITQTDLNNIVVFSVNGGGNVTFVGSNVDSTGVVHNGTITNTNQDKIAIIAADGQIASSSAKIGGILDGNVVTMNANFVTANVDKLVTVASDGKIKVSSAKVGGVVNGNVVTMNETITDANANKLVSISGDGKIKVNIPATRNELFAGADLAKSITAFDLCELLFHFQHWDRGSMSGAVSGTGANVTGGGIGSYLNAPTSGAGYAVIRTFGTSQVDQTNNLWGVTFQQLNFSESKRMGGRSYFSTPTDPNLIVSCLWGPIEADAVGDLVSGRKGIGIRCIGHATTPYLQLTVGSGTGSPTIVNSSYIVTTAPFNWTVYSDGAGNVYLYVNGSLVASTALGPTGTSSASTLSYREQIVSSATPASAFSRFVNARGGYIC